MPPCVLIEKFMGSLSDVEDMVDGKSGGCDCVDGAMERAELESLAGRRRTAQGRARVVAEMPNRTGVLVQCKNCPAGSIGSPETGRCTRARRGRRVEPPHCPMFLAGPRQLSG